MDAVHTSADASAHEVDVPIAVGDVDETSPHRVDVLHVEHTGDVARTAGTHPGVGVDLPFVFAKHAVDGALRFVFFAKLGMRSSLMTLIRTIRRIGAVYGAAGKGDATQEKVPELHRDSKVQVLIIETTSHSANTGRQGFQEIPTCRDTHSSRLPPHSPPYRCT